jgi:hypothetical protein
MKVKRKLWVTIFGEYNFRQVVDKLCPERNIEVLVGFKPDMMVDMHLGLKGKKEDIESLKQHLIENGHEAVSRKPRRAFSFDFS